MERARSPSEIRSQSQYGVCQYDVQLNTRHAQECPAQLWCGTHVLPSASNCMCELQHSLRAPILQANFILNV
jgi:hypothetical protein